jgi:hypothetical protein
MSGKNIDTGMRDRWMAEGIILSFRLCVPTAENQR